MTAAGVVSKWFELYNDGTPDRYGGTEFVSLYADDFNWVEKPSQFSPEGRAGDANEVRAGVANAALILVDRRIEVEQMVEDGDTVATYGSWSATVAVDGLEWPKGAKLTVPIAQFFTVRNDKITSCIDFLTHPVALTD